MACIPTSDLSIVGNPPEDVSGIKLKMTVANALVSAEDNFVLRFVDEETFLANESQKAREELARMTRWYCGGLKCGADPWDIRS